MSNKAFLALFCLLVVICSCSKINHFLGLRNDNLIEEAIEDVIEHQTGLDIDLTPADGE